MQKGMAISSKQLIGPATPREGVSPLETIGGTRSKPCAVSPDAAPRCGMGASIVIQVLQPVKIDGMVRGRCEIVDVDVRGLSTLLRRGEQDAIRIYSESIELAALKADLTVRKESATGQDLSAIHEVLKFIERSATENLKSQRAIACSCEES
jgi:hypothetical protein